VTSKVNGGISSNMALVAIVPNPQQVAAKSIKITALDCLTRIPFQVLSLL
jgi:hypothetical protein